MPLPPFTTPVPRPVFMPGISYQTEAPAPPAPPAPSAVPVSQLKDEHLATDNKDKDPFPLPKLRLEIRDLSHAGSSIFLRSINASSVFSTAVLNVLKWLYTSPSNPYTHAPGTRSVTLVLRPMDGVAYTTGIELDDDHKEIHFNLSYIAQIAADRQVAEITGVITHELVHCYQWNGKGTCPGGLIEGIADWVRLQCDLAPPHWKREEVGDRWDAGYERTAFFLTYLEERYGEGTVRKINEKLRVSNYEQKTFWTELLGRPVEQLWEDYKKKIGGTAST